MQIKKAKNAYVYDSHSVKYFDFRDNSNIIGFSHKSLTTIVKNKLSNSWNITLKTIHHQRMTNLYKNMIGTDYILSASNSLEEFIARLMLNSRDSYSIEITGKNFDSWLRFKNIFPVSSTVKKKISLFDVNELFLESGGNTDTFKNKINSLKTGNILILNYYWFPLTEVAAGSADIIILPKIFCGNFNYAGILMKKGLQEFTGLTQSICDIPSLYISSSLKNYYLIREMQEKYDGFKLNWEGFIQAQRLFIPADTGHAKKLSEILSGEKIIINENPPYYDYLPIILEDYQKKFLEKIKF
jgi:hypothetical protein